MDKIAEQKAKEAFCLKEPKLTCDNCRYPVICEKRVQAILDLIASEQKPMVDLLKRIQIELTYMNEVDLSLTGEGKECLAKIDAVLPKGEGK